MAARRGRDEWSVNSGDKTFGHHLLTTEHVRALSQTADHWAIILHFESREEMPKHSFFRAAAMVDMFEQGKLCRATLMAGLRTSRCPSKEEGVPSCFFRTLDFLLQFVAAGNNYRAVTDKEIAKGFPPAGWCRPPVVAAAEDSDVAQLAALEGPSGQPEALELAPMADPIRLFYAARSWAYIYSYHIAASTIRVQIGAPPQDLYHLWHSGQVSEYTLAVGLLDDAPPTNLWCPPCVMVPLGALLYMHGHGRPYLPVELRELREIRANGIMACGTRKDARPLALPAGVYPYAPEPEPKPYEQDDYEPQPEKSSRNGGASGSSSRQMSRTTSSALGTTASSGGRGGNGGGGGDGNRQTSNSGAATTAPLPLPPPPLELDPILDSAKWIMPAPFDTPLPPPPPETPAEAVPAAAAAEAPALPPSPFLGELNFGVQSTFETPPVRLFLGERGDAGLRGNWYFVEGVAAAAEQGGSGSGGGGGAVRGPYSPEQMLLSYVAGCRELHEETLVCGLDADVRPPAPPPRQAFQPLGSLLEAINAGNCYALVSATDLRSANSPLAQTLLGNRTRAPRPAAAAAAAPSPSPTEPAAGSVAAAQPTVVRVASVSAPTVVAPAVVVPQVPVVAPPAAPPPPQQQPAMVQVQAQVPPPLPQQQQQQPQPVPQVQVQPLIQVQPQNQPPPTVRPMLVRPMQLPPHMGGPRPMMMAGGPPTMMYGGMMPPPGAVQPMQMQPGMMQPMQMQPGMVVQPMMMPQGMGQPQQMMMPGPGGMAPPRHGMYQA